MTPFSVSAYILVEIMSHEGRAGVREVYLLVDVSSSSNKDQPSISGQ